MSDRATVPVALGDSSIGVRRNQTASSAIGRIVTPPENRPPENSFTLMGFRIGSPVQRSPSWHRFDRRTDGQGEPVFTSFGNLVLIIMGHDSRAAGGVESSRLFRFPLMA